MVSDEPALTLVVIPARGGSKGIPRKNLRLLGGRPLITHVILATNYLKDCRAVVSTDDDEIAEVARLSGAEVIIRPAELANDEATLDEAVACAWEQAEQLHGHRYENIVTLQPTSPFTSADTVRTAIEMLDEFDSVLSVIDARHLRWTEDDNAPIPLYSERVNRQRLPPTWAETGGIIACRRQILSTGSRIGGRVGLLCVDEKESLDIDTHTDWAVAESLIYSPRMAIRVIGDHQHGLGHVFRGLTLADAMYSKPLFLTPTSSNLAAKMIHARNHDHLDYENRSELIEILLAQGTEVLISDVLDTDAKEMREIGEATDCILVNFEDLGSGSALADITFNALYEHEFPLPNQRYGWRWFCLREEFLNCFNSPSKDSASTNVIIAFGGTDPRELTDHVIELISQQRDLCENIDMTVVVGPGNPRLSEIEAMVAKRSAGFSSIRVLHSVNRMSNLMVQADFAITSNGRTVFELAACSTPMIVICQNERETKHTFTQECGAAIELGYTEHFPSDEFIEAFRSMSLDLNMREEMMTNLDEFNLQGGTRRVLDEITNLYRERMLRS